jgi:hypothetical protein
MWKYVQRSGELFDSAGHCQGVGYSGIGLGKNNPAQQSVHNVGPIPVGTYTIGLPHNSDTHGPFVLPLTPYSGNEMFGRSGFLIHGDSVINAGMASEGCIIQARATRDAVANSDDTTLQVVSGEDQAPDADGEIAT